MARQNFRYELEGYGNVHRPRSPSRIYDFMDRLGHRNVSTPDPGSWTPAGVTQVLHWVLGSTQ